MRDNIFTTEYITLTTAVNYIQRVVRSDFIDDELIQVIKEKQLDVYINLDDLRLDSEHAHLLDNGGFYGTYADGEDMRCGLLAYGYHKVHSPLIAGSNIENAHVVITYDNSPNYLGSLLEGVVNVGYFYSKQEEGENGIKATWTAGGMIDDAFENTVQLPFKPFIKAEDINAFASQLLESTLVQCKVLREKQVNVLTNAAKQQPKIQQSKQWKWKNGKKPTKYDAIDELGAQLIQALLEHFDEHQKKPTASLVAPYLKGFICKRAGGFEFKENISSSSTEFIKYHALNARIDRLLEK